MVNVVGVVGTVNAANSVPLKVLGTNAPANELAKTLELNRKEAGLSMSIEPLQSDNPVTAVVIVLLI